MPNKTKVVIVGAGFAGLNAAKALARTRDVEVTIVDRRNFHLFQPLLYQVATAGLNPADIASPIRSILSRQRNARVLHGEVVGVDFERRVVSASFGELQYDYLLLACGADHSYFGNEDWRSFAPGLKTIEEATDIRQRILSAYEQAETESDSARRRQLLTFVVVGGGPTGVEMAGAIGEMSRFTLARDFRSIDAKSTRIFLIEAGPRILSAFPKELSDRAARDLESLGVQIWTSSPVRRIDAGGVEVDEERIAASTVIWAAGVKASGLGTQLGLSADQQGRVMVNDDLSIEGHPEVFVAGDQAHAEWEGEALPGVAPVAQQQGRYLGRLIRGELQGRPRVPFKYRDKGIMATIGRNRAVVASGKWKFSGWLAWLAWLVVHIFFLTGFRNRIFVFLNWVWCWLTYRRGARLIVGSATRFNASSQQTSSDCSHTSE